MNFKRHLSLLAILFAMIFTFVAGAQSNFVAKSASSSKVISGDKVYVQSSNSTVNKDITGLNISNGSKTITIDNSNSGSNGGSTSATSGVVTASALNVRSGPSTSYSVIGSLSKGANVEIVSNENGWYKIKYGSGYGYVSSDYINVSSAIPPSNGGSNTPSGSIKKIVIDPGHGGSDPGAVGPNNVKEKDVVLSVGLKMRDMLKAKGYTVIMTRDTDVFVSLQGRCDIANNANADFFLSIHANSASSPTANGTETYSLSSTGQAANIAKTIQSELVSALNLTNRGHKTANFHVLRYTNMPSVLAELAFINNPAEESLLRTDAFQTKAAEAMVKAITQY